MATAGASVGELGDSSMAVDALFSQGGGRIMGSAKIHRSEYNQETFWRGECFVSQFEK